MKPYQLYLIGNAHIDPVWLWQWPEGFHEIKTTFRSALDRMVEDPEFVFTHGSAAHYAWVEASDPSMFAEIRARVGEGRWQLVGGWWVQPDCNLPGGESFVRQGLYGQRYFIEHLGQAVVIGSNEDSFGHNAGLPQILSKSGIRAYLFMRPEPVEMELPGRAFWWQGSDGSRVLAFRIPFQYQTFGPELEQHVRRCASELGPDLPQSLCFYGVGDHGGGPTRENLQMLHHLAQDPTLPDLTFGRLEQFFDRAAGRDLPVVHGELQHHASGCYAAHSGVKRWNRQAENLLLAAEKFSSVAAWELGVPYPGNFTDAWKTLLFNQFHDILAGTCIEPAYTDAQAQFGEVVAVAGRGLNAALQALTWEVRVTEEECLRPIVVFNPNTWPVHAVVEMEFIQLPPVAYLLDDQGQRIPIQDVPSEATIAGKGRLCFPADLPALGYRTYRFCIGETPRTDADLPQADNVLENEHLRLEIHPSTGWVSRLVDKQAGVDVFAGPAARPVVLEDPGDTWGHGILRYNQSAGDFELRSLRRVVHGPVKSTLRVISTYHQSTLVQDFSLSRGTDQIDVNVQVDWHEPFKVVKLRFPLNLERAEAAFEIPYGSIVRPMNGEEEPGQAWVDVTGAVPGGVGTYGLSVLNDGKYSYDVQDVDIGLTVLRSPLYAHHFGPVDRDAEWLSFIDQGLQRFSYSLYPHAGSWREAGTPQRAGQLNQRPTTMIGTAHPRGRLPQATSFLEVSPSNVVVTVLKRAEDADGWILRAYETNGVETTAEIRFPRWGRGMRVPFGPAEIKTLHIPDDAQQAVEETDLIERLSEL